MDQFNLEIISPEKSFLTKSDTEEVVIPAIEGYMGILKDHIPLISFLKPGIIDVRSKNETLNYYCLLYTSPSPRDISGSRMPSSA